MDQVAAARKNVAEAEAKLVEARTKLIREEAAAKNVKHVSQMSPEERKAEAKRRGF